MPAPSLHRESTDSLIYFFFFGKEKYNYKSDTVKKTKNNNIKSIDSASKVY